MAYLSNIRIDQKCGKSGIAKGKKCKKGAGSTFSQGNLGEKAVMGSGAFIAGAGIGNALRNLSDLPDTKKYHHSLAVSGGGTAIMGAGTALTGRRTGNKKMQKEGERQVATGALLAGANAALGSKRFQKKAARGLTKLGRGARTVGQVLAKNR